MTYTLLAEDPAPAQQQQPPNPLESPLFLLLIGVMFLMLVIMPFMNRRQKREQEALLASLKRGAKVVTNAGIVGVIVSAKDGEDEVVIKSEDTRLRIKRNVVIQVLGTDEAEAAKS
jgi:preprotein translocase subunit YajC